MESAPTKEAVLAGAAAKGLIPYLLDQRMAYSLGSDEDFLELVAGLVNDGSLPLRTEGDDRHMAGMAPALYFSGLSLVCKLIPRLDVDLEAMMKLVTTLVHHGGNDLCAGTPNTAFVSWCTRDKGRVDRVLAHARAGEALALSHLRSALVAGQRVVEAVEFLDSDHIKAVVEAASALGAMEMDDGGAQRSSEALVKVMADSDDENVLRLALLSFFRILDDHAEHPRKHARALLNVVGQRGSPEGKYALAQVLTHYGEDLTEEEVLIAVDGLKTIGPEDEGVIMQVDLASRKLGAGSDAKFGGLTNLVAKLIRQWQGRLTLEAFPTFWEQLISDGGRRLHRTVVEWLLDGNFWLCTSLSKMITGYTEPYRLDLVKGLLPNAGSDQIFLCRKATGFLFVSPITAASVLVSTLRHGDPDVAEDVAELLYDPLLVNYSGVLRAYLEGVAKTDNSPSGRWIRSALDRAQSVASLEGLMPLPELWPSEARRHMNHVHQSQLMAKAMRHGSQKSILRKIAQESHLLYGNASTLYVEDLANPSGERRRIDVPLMQHSVQVDLPMLSIFDPEGLELALWRLQTGKRVAP